VNQVFCVVMNDHGYVSFVVVIVKPSFRCSNVMIMDMFRLSLSWLSQVFCVVMNDHGYVPFVVVTYP
jgi:hypothetical protein